MSYERKPSVLLCELWERESAQGNVYFGGFMGGLSVARNHPRTTTGGPLHVRGREWQVLGSG